MVTVCIPRYCHTDPIRWTMTSRKGWVALLQLIMAEQDRFIFSSHGQQRKTVRGSRTNKLVVAVVVFVDVGQTI
jgi:hypothetical protein